jgi:hypothetical protein
MLLSQYGGHKDKAFTAKCVCVCVCVCVCIVSKQRQQRLTHRESVIKVRFTARCGYGSVSRGWGVVGTAEGLCETVGIVDITAFVAQWSLYVPPV